MQDRILDRFWLSHDAVPSRNWGLKITIPRQQARQVQKYEKGVNRIGANRLQQICAALDCGVTDLLGSSKKVAKITPSSTFAASRDGVAIIDAMAKIKDPDLRRHVIRLTECLAG